MVERRAVYWLRTINENLNAEKTAEVSEFYEVNKNSFVGERSPITFLNSLKSGRSVVIRDQSEKLVAAALTFDYGHRHIETGSHISTVRGFGFQRHMIRYQTLESYTYRPPQQHFYATCQKKTRNP
jgi:hypothetical protein